MKEGGVSRYCVTKFLSQSTKKIRRGTFYYLQNFWYRKTSCIRGGEGSREECHDILSKTFCLRVPKNFLGNIPEFH